MADPDRPDHPAGPTPPGNDEAEPTLPLGDQAPGYWEQQQPWGRPYPQSYPPPGGQGWPPPPGAYYGQQLAPPHRDANTALILGIVSLAGGLMLVLPFVVGPFAWSTGRRVLREIDASHGQLGGRESANAGMIMGIVSTALLAVGLVALVLFGVLIVAMARGSMAT